MKTPISLLPGLYSKAYPRSLADSEGGSKFAQPRIEDGHLVLSTTHGIEAHIAHARAEHDLAGHPDSVEMIVDFPGKALYQGRAVDSMTFIMRLINLPRGFIKAQRRDDRNIEHMVLCDLVRLFVDHLGVVYRDIGPIRLTGLGHKEVFSIPTAWIETDELRLCYHPLFADYFVEVKDDAPAPPKTKGK